MGKHHLGFAIGGSLISILFLLIVNYLTSSDHLWFIYPSFFLLLWPMSLYFIRNREAKGFSLICSIVIILFLAITNYLESPSHLWVLYAIYPIAWWPIILYSGKKAYTVWYAWIACLCTIAYYTVLNLTLSPSYAWAIYPIYLVLWWPISVYYAKRNNYFGLSITASLLTIFFFIGVNSISSPQVVWAVYPIFIILWWPLSMYYYSYQKKKFSPSLEEE
jgi:hypothetical protein